MTVTRPRTPALSPEFPVRAPGLSMTGQREFTTGQKGGDKFSDIPAIPDAARHEMLRCWSGTHILRSGFMDPVSAPHRCALQCARDGVCRCAGTLANSAFKGQQDIQGEAVDVADVP